MEKKKKLLVYLLVVLGLLLFACMPSSAPTVKAPDEVPAGATEETPVLGGTVEPTLPPVGTSRSNPAMMGSEVSVDDMTFTVLETVRPADDLVAAGNMFNAAPEEGNEYVLVRLRIRCDKGADNTCLTGSFEFSVVDSGGIAHDPNIFIDGVSGMLEFGEMFGGSTMEGSIVFEVPQGDAGLVLIYEPLFGSKTFLSIP